MEWYRKPLRDIIAELSVDTSRGLSADAVQKRQREFGKNILPRGKKLRWQQLFLRQFKNPLVFILLIAAFLTFWLNSYIDLTVILLAVFVNVSIGFWQEFRSNRIFEKLQRLVVTKARVKRDRKIIEVDMTDLVPGDIIMLHGDIKIPADARILSSKNLLVNESILTGESRAVNKHACDISSTTVIGDRANMAHMGTIIERGEGEALVVAIAKETEIGKIALLTASVREDKTPLQERLAKLGKILAIFVAIAAFIILVVGSLEGRSLVKMFTVATAIAVAAIPEGLPAALSAVLAVSATKILRRKGLVKTLIGAETLGSASVIVTDKTGTLTKGAMEVIHLLEAKDAAEARLAMALASDVLVMQKDGELELRGEATDKAKVEYFLKQGGNLETVFKDYPRISLLPFNPEKKYIASFHKTRDNNAKIFVSGAPEVLLNLSTLPKTEQQKILSEIEKYALRGFRMIGIASRNIKGSAELDSEDYTELDKLIGDLAFLGIAAIRDPIRNDVHASIKTTRNAGIRVIMATGDHHLTAQAIGKELDFAADKEAVLNGEEIGALNDDELAKAIKKVEIFSRINPAHKMRLVEILRKQGEIVAMTGDGVNDAPALRAADIGVALGSGTDVTKEASDLVLMDDSFSIITSAIQEGRIAFDNIRKVAVFLLSNSFTEIIIVLAALIFRTEFLPVTAVQILWANLVEDSFPNFALAFEPGEKDIMARAPLKRGEPILDKQGVTIIFIVGILSDLMLVGIFFYLYFYSLFAIEHIQTLIFSLLATNSLFIVFAIKSYRSSILQTKLLNNPFLIFAVLAGLLLMVLAIYAPPLQRLLGTVSLSVGEVIFILAVGFFQLILIEIVKWRFAKFNRS